SDTRTALDGMVFNREGTMVRPFIDGGISSHSGAGTTRTTSGGPEAEIANRAYGGPINGAEVVGRSTFLAAQYQFTDTFSMYLQMVGGVSESNNKPNRADVMGINMTSIWAP